MTNLHIPPLAVGPSRRVLPRARRLGLVCLGVLLIGGGLRLALNYRDAHALQQRTAASLERTVNFVYPRPGEAKRTVSLPATLRGGSETAIHARSPGYVAAWYKTIGDSVQKGELLATLDAPEQDQELAQARAGREQIRVRRNLARQTLERWEGLRALDSVSQQDLEEKRAARALAEADLAAAEANVKRLEQLQGFRRIVAPFAGVVTRRSVEVGNLVTAGGKELFAITQTDPLRLTLWVPQVYASGIKAGQEVSVRVNEIPGKPFTGTIEHAAGALDPVTRSRQVDLLLPNPEGKLLPGAYAEATLHLTSGVKALSVPANVLVLGQDGPRVIAIDGENRLAFKPVKLGRDLGREVEILSGIGPEERLVSSPADVLVEGEKVAVREAASKGAGENGAGKARKPGVPPRS